MKTLQTIILLQAINNIFGSQVINGKPLFNRTYNSNSQCGLFYSNRQLSIKTLQAFNDADRATSQLIAIKKELGKRYFAALTKCDNQTQASRREIFKAVKGGKKNITQKRFMELVYELHSINEAFIAKKHIINRGLEQYTESNKPAKEIHSKVKQNANANANGGVLTRYKDKKYDRAIGAIHRLIPSVSGDTSIRVEFTNDPKKISYSSTTEKGNTYSRRCTYRKTNLSVKAVLPSNWYSRIYQNELAKLDNLITLNASTPLLVDMAKFGDISGDIKVYAATWLQRSRGASYTTKTGFIVVGSEISSNERNFFGRICYHGKTLNTAISGFNRKIENYVDPLTAKLKRHARLLERASKINVFVSVKDSYHVGNCQSGTLDFCYRHDIDVNGTIPLKELVKLYGLEPRSEVLSVISYMCRKSKDLAATA